MGKFGRREGNDSKLKSKLRHGSMGVVIFDHQEVCRNVKPFVISLTNAAHSLANWSLRENNIAIKDVCTKMYEISCLLFTAMESFSKEYLEMGNSLKDLLHQEMDLNSLNKKVCHSEERVAKLKKQNVEREKKDSKRLSFLEDLGNAELEFEELKASFDAQSTRHEILKAKCLRDAIIQLADGTTMLSVQLSNIGEAQKELGSTIPVVPTQIRKEKEYQGSEHTDEIVGKTADALKVPRPPSFSEQQAMKIPHERKKASVSCFYPEPSPPLQKDEDWFLIDPQNDIDEDPNRQNHQDRLDRQMMSSLKNRLGIDTPHGRSYISNPGIEQRQVVKSRGLHSKAVDTRMSPPLLPPPRSPKKAQVLSDFPPVEPYAISGHRPDIDGLYARADLFVSSTSTRRPCRSWETKRNFWTEAGYDNMRGKENLSNKETLETTEQEEKVEKVVYAVLEREEDEKTSNDSPYLDVIH